MLSKKIDRAMRELEEYLQFSSLSAAEREEYIGTDGDIVCGVFVAIHLPVFCGKVLWPGLDDVALRKKVVSGLSGKHARRLV